MVRGLKKKLLIGLLSAAVVGTSLAPNVPLVGSFAQEVKAEGEGTEGETPQGEGTQGETPQGEGTQGETPQGEGTQGETPTTGDQQSSTDSSSLTVTGDAVTSVKIQQSGQDDKTSTSGAAVSVKDGIDTVIKATLSVEAGKKVTKVEAKYTQGGITQTVNGTFNSATKEAAFNIGKVFNGMIVTIEAKVEDVKIQPTLKTSLKGATAAFEGETEVKQVGGKLTIVVTPSDAKKLNDIKGKIKITVDGKNIAISEKEVPGKLYYEISGFESEKPVIVVSGGLNNNNEHISGDDYSKVEAPYDVAIDDSAVLDAYKESNESDKNTAVKIEATTSTKAPEAFENAIAGLVAKNPYLKAAINVDVKLSAAQVDGKANSETVMEPIANAEFKTPIPIKVTLPSDAAGKGGYIVLRKHGDDVETLTTTLKDGEGISVNATGTELTIYTKKLSDFTVLYDSSLTSNTEENNNGENNNGENNENNNSENNGSNSSSSSGTTATTSTTSAATSTTKAAKATTSTKKSSKTSSPKTADYAVNSLLALLTGAAGLFGITLVNKKRKEDEE